MSRRVNGAEQGLTRISFPKVVVMLRRVMDTSYQTLRSYLPSTERFDRLMEIGWEDTGGMLLAIVAIAFMSLVGALRSQ